VALASSGDVDGARRVAAEAYERNPGDPGLLDLLEGYAMQAKDVEAVTRWRERRSQDAPWSVRGR
ncbi:MAG: hypothetical protein JRJ84_22700, partial [Deltaproteobacteria bacterium]|nr:hypothetical protein [Deltaproteobacteria bacterium]